MEGLVLVRADWQALFDNEQGREWLNPLHLMGSDEITPEEQQLIDTAEQREVPHQTDSRQHRRDLSFLAASPSGSP